MLYIRWSTWENYELLQFAAILIGKAREKVWFGPWAFVGVFFLYMALYKIVPDKLGGLLQQGNSVGR